LPALASLRPGWKRTWSISEHKTEPYGILPIKSKLSPGLAEFQKFFENGKKRFGETLLADRLGSPKNFFKNFASPGKRVRSSKSEQGLANETRIHSYKVKRCRCNILL